MAHTMAFDSLAFSKKLTASGMPSPQAETLAEAVFEVLDENLTAVAAKQDVDLSESSTKQEISLLRFEFDSKLSKLKTELIMWMVGLLFAQAALMISVIKFIN